MLGGMTTAPTPRPGALVFTTRGDDNVTRRVVNTPQEIRCPAGSFVIESAMGYRTIGTLTGRTAQRWGFACPTLTRCEVETVADPDGSIWGVPGERIAGTLAVRPEEVC